MPSCLALEGDLQAYTGVWITIQAVWPNFLSVSEEERMEYALKLDIYNEAELKEREDIAAEIKEKVDVRHVERKLALVNAYKKVLRLFLDYPCAEEVQPPCWVYVPDPVPIYEADFDYSPYVEPAPDEYNVLSFSADGNGAANGQQSASSLAQKSRLLVEEYNTIKLLYSVFLTDKRVRQYAQNNPSMMELIDKYGVINYVDGYLNGTEAGNAMLQEAINFELSALGIETEIKDLAVLPVREGESTQFMPPGEPETWSKTQLLVIGSIVFAFLLTAGYLFFRWFRAWRKRRSMKSSSEIDTEESFEDWPDMLEDVQLEMSESTLPIEDQEEKVEYIRPRPQYALAPLSRIERPREIENYQSNPQLVLPPRPTLESHLAVVSSRSPPTSPRERTKDAILRAAVRSTQASMKIGDQVRKSISQSSLEVAKSARGPPKGGYEGGGEGRSSAKGDPDATKGTSGPWGKKDGKKDDKGKKKDEEPLDPREARKKWVPEGLRIYLLEI